MRTRLLTITLAAVLALLGVVAVLAYVHQANERAVNGLKAETVVMAAKAIPAGTSLSKAQDEHLLGTEKVPDSSLSTAAVQSVTAANGHLVVSAAVPEGSVLLANMLAKHGALIAGNVSALALPQGDIGVTMAMCLSADVAGYVEPGSYITVFDTYPTHGVMSYTCTTHTPPSTGSVLARVIVRRVEVLSVTPVSSQGTSSVTGQLASADPTNQQSLVASAGEVLVTLAATNQTMAENLALINTAGDPTFGLLTTGSATHADGPAPGGALEFPAP